MKAVTIFWIVFICLSLVIGITEYKNNQMNIENLKINSKQFNSIYQPLPEGKYVLCSMKEEDKNNPCVLMFKERIDGS